MNNARRSHCLRGHELFGDNVRITHRGRRECQECHKLHQANYRAKQRAKLNRPTKRDIAVRKLAENTMPVTESGCMLWTAATDRFGYGRVYVFGNTIRAHRASWMIHRGDIPEGLQVLHKCDTPLCLNPDHQFLGTPAINSADKMAKGRGGQPKGEVNGNAKLCAQDVMAILADNRTQVAIAQEYGVSTSAISGIKTGRSWSHLKEPQE